MNHLKLKRLGIRKRAGNKIPNRASAQEWDFILDNVAALGFIRCAELTLDTPDNLRERCYRKGIDIKAIDKAFNGGPFSERPFSDDEIQYIQDRFTQDGGVRIGLLLGRRPEAIINFAKRRLGMKSKVTPTSPVPDFTVI